MGKALKDMTFEELREEARPILEKEEKQHRENIDQAFKLFHIETLDKKGSEVE